MQLSTMLLALLFVAADALAATRPPFNERPDHYIAVFNTHADNHTRALHLTKHQKLALSDPESAIHAHVNFGNFEAYMGKFTKTFIASAMADGVVSIQPDIEVSLDDPADPEIKIDDPNVSHVVLNPDRQNPNTTVVDASCTTQSSAVWGLVRSSQRDRKLNGKYPYEADGDGVDAYIIDTGLYTEHNDFEGRATFGTSFTNENHGSDKNGHGTHCAGTIGATTYGVAKAANLIGVQVLSSTGSGYMSWVMQGMNWVCNQHKKSNNKCVVNLSLSGSYYADVNKAANSLVECGCTVAVAAGNAASDACDESPASASDVITVGASGQQDKGASFTNYGTCVDIFGPGVYITSTWIGSKNAINTLSGTSMASPHVCGVAAKILSAAEKKGVSLDSDKVKEELLSDGTENKLSNIGTNSPNLLLYRGCSE